MTQNTSPYILIYVTCGSQDNAQEIAAALVQERLAACVNILPSIQSIYRWQDKLETGNEYLLLIKTQHDKFVALRERVCNLHHYELPEIVAVPIVAGLEPYLNWITESVTHHAQ
jgi:uncharacterized protein involved in tolerance to divalent cations